MITWVKVALESLGLRRDFSADFGSTTLLRTAEFQPTSTVSDPEILLFTHTPFLYHQILHPFNIPEQLAPDWFDCFVFDADPCVLSTERWMTELVARSVFCGRLLQGEDVHPEVGQPDHDAVLEMFLF